MIKNFAFKSGILFFVFLLILGCASLPRPDEMKAQVANYQLPRLPNEGKAIVYVVNPSTFAKHASKSGYMFEVYLDNKDSQSEVGATLGQQYIYFSITPGEHKIMSKAGNWAEINVSAKAGDIIFIQQDPYMGFTTLNIRLLNLQDYEGKYYVKTLPRVESSVTIRPTQRQHLPLLLRFQRFLPGIKIYLESPWVQQAVSGELE